jgi:hypothetical protein
MPTDLDTYFKKLTGVNTIGYSAFENTQISLELQLNRLSINSNMVMSVVPIEAIIGFLNMLLRIVQTLVEL